MKAVIIFIGVIILLFVIIRAAIHNHAIRRRRCPRCGAPIIPFYDGQQSGYQCTECEWWEVTNDFNTI